jgi:hypothetical protein
MQPYKGYFISASAMPVHPFSPDWYVGGSVLVPGRGSSIDPGIWDGSARSIQISLGDIKLRTWGRALDKSLVQEDTDSIFLSVHCRAKLGRRNPAVRKTALLN